MKPSMLATIAVVVIVAIGAFVFISSDDSTDTTNESNEATSQTDNNTATPAEEVTTVEQDQNGMGTYTAAEVAMHDSEADCWTIVDGTVYDLTEYIPRHRGGDEILRACGGDGSSLFNERQTADGEAVGSGTPHSSNAGNQLADLEIGTLAQ